MASFGDRLRRAREKKSITLEQIAEGTKIGVRYLRALEEGDYDPLPGGVFDRGYVRAYAQAVGLDPDATVRAYLEERGADDVESDRDERTLEALRRAADRHSGGAASTIPWLSLSSTQRNVLIGTAAVVVVALSVWGVIALVGTGDVPGGPRPTTNEADRTVQRTAKAEPPRGEGSISTGAGREPSDRNATRSAGVNRGSTSGPATKPEERQVATSDPSGDAPGSTSAPPVESESTAADPDDVTPDPTPTTTAAAPTRPRATPRPTPAPKPTVVAPTDPPPAPNADPEPAAAQEDVPIRARIVLDRAVTGSVNCDNRRVEVLDGMRVGTVLDLACRRFLLLNVPDGAGIRVGLNGRPPVALVEDGESLDRFGIYR
jgi:transcriptional regulator with XRE-family HTH domain